jgi:hypothetical protein
MKLELVGYFEIASRAGVQRQVVSVWRTRYADFPLPGWELKIGPIWEWGTVKKWLILHGKKWDENWTYEQVIRRAPDHRTPSGSRPRNRSAS